jgi:hypothetical protein
MGLGVDSGGNGEKSANVNLLVDLVMLGLILMLGLKSNPI